MPASIEMLKRKIARLRQGLDEVDAALDELAGSLPAPGEPEAARPNPLAGLEFSDPKALLPVLDRAFAEMGIDVSGPAPTPEEVQQLMLQEGVKPEDNLGSRAIIEARDE